MKKTKIEWADSTWNPVTGCLHGCPYCYARRMAQRFAGSEATLIPWLRDLDEPYRTVLFFSPETGNIIKGKAEPYPYGFAPTFHRYRLDIPARWTKPRTIFVCSMADLFGAWVPDEWIKAVIDACKAAPQHRYLFLTKNPARYMFLEDKGLLPHDENFWFGSTVTKPGDKSMWSTGIFNNFVSIEPILAELHLPWPGQLPEWVIIGAETGTRKDKVVPKPLWIAGIVSECDEAGIPVFMKDSLITIIGEENMRRDFPWKTEAEP